MQRLDINMAEEENMMETDAIALDDIKEDSVNEDMDVANIVDYVMGRFKKYKRKSQFGFIGMVKNSWLLSYFYYLGK